MSTISHRVSMRKIVFSPHSGKTRSWRHRLDVQGPKLAALSLDFLDITQTTFAPPVKPRRK